MIFNKLIEESKKYWETYLQRIQYAQEKGLLDSGDGFPLYSNIMLATDFNGFYAIELVGASKKFNGLSLKIHKEKSIYKYLSQFDEDSSGSLLKLDGENNGFRFLALAQGVDIDSAKKRFPHIELYKSALMRQGGSGCIFSFGENFKSCAIENSVLINKKDDLFRAKGILSLFIVRKNITERGLIELFDSCTNGKEVKGIHTASETDARILIGGALQSMVLLPGLRETTIGEFINKHPEIINKAFKTNHFLYEPEFKWLEHDGTCTDTAINPDLMVRRADGFYDILDLKTALLDKRKITKASRSRRRFIDAVCEGLAQLANYKEYFSYERNIEHATQKYGVEIKDPKLVLVIGSWENVDTQEVLQACRQYIDVSVIDYDTLCHIFIGSNENRIN